MFVIIARLTHSSETKTNYWSFIDFIIFIEYVVVQIQRIFIKTPLILYINVPIIKKKQLYLWNFL